MLWITTALRSARALPTASRSGILEWIVAHCDLSALYDGFSVLDLCGRCGNG